MSKDVAAGVITGVIVFLLVIAVDIAHNLIYGESMNFMMFIITIIAAWSNVDVEVGDE